MPNLIRGLVRLVQGPPIPSKRARHERLSVIFALPTFAADALSSVAYATEAIMLVLLAASIHHLPLVVPISTGIAVLLAVVAASYTQTVLAYPTGGGSYIVASENLGSGAGRVAGAALLIGYVLTVSVSEAAAVAAMISAFPNLQPMRPHLATAMILGISLVNLRGIRESGVFFAVPTYLFVLSMLSLVGLGMWKVVTGGIQPMNPVATQQAAATAVTPIGFFMLLRAYSAGCTALTGVEAIANGVPAFRPPESINAARTLRMLAVISITLFVGTSFLASKLHVIPIHEGTPGYETVLSMIARGLAGKTWFYYVIQAATVVILILAANTAFADFPRLCSFIARDGFLPRQLTNLGDRLVFHWGIVLLTAVSIGLIYAFGGETNRLLPLYAGSVFITFSLSQFGMVAHWRRLGGNVPKMMMNLLGAVATTIVGIVFVVSKFTEGAWMIPVIGAGMMWVFTRIRRHYERHTQQLQLQDFAVPAQRQTTAIVLVPRLHIGTIAALNYARSIGLDCRALHVSVNPAKTQELKRDWERYNFGIPLVILESQYRSLVDPIIEYVDETLKESPDRWVTVIVPEAVPAKWWHRALHNNAAVPIKLALSQRKRVVITNVRYHLE
ncbi:MAG: amino acid transporter [Fimbriimonadales bacterium]